MSQFGHQWRFALKGNISIAHLIFVILIIFMIPVSNGGTQCPAQCACSTSQYDLGMDCNSRELSTIPHFPQQTTRIYLSNNNFIVLKNNSFQFLSHVTYLQISYSHVSILEAGVFRDMTSLAELILSYNAISSLPDHLLDTLSSLTHLDISNNQLKSLPENLFRHSQSLQTVDISHNQINEIINGTLRYLQNLEEINMATNLNMKIPVNTFHGLSVLLRLNLSNIGLHSLSKDFFKGQLSLNHLDLSNNDFDTFEPKYIPHSISVYHLNLSGNPMLCDCNILPLRQWLDQGSSVAWGASTVPRCAGPRYLQGDLLTQIPLEQLTCPLTLPTAKAIREILTKSKQRRDNQFTSKLGKIPYNPLLGWYTAAVLSGMLVVFLLCVALDQVKQTFYKWRRKRRAAKETRTSLPGNGDPMAMEGLQSSRELRHSHNGLQARLSIRSDSSGYSVFQPQLSIRSGRSDGSAKFSPIVTEIYPSQDIVIEVSDHSYDHEKPIMVENTAGGSGHCETTL